MRHSKAIEILILGLWFLIAVTVFWKYKFSNKEIKLPENMDFQNITEVQVGKTFDIRKISILQGISFDITLKDDANSRILAELPVKPTADARNRLVDLLNQSAKPSLMLKQKQENGKWIIDLFVYNADKKLNIADWLKENKLIYQ